MYATSQNDPIFYMVCPQGASVYIYIGILEDANIPLEGGGVHLNSHENNRVGGTPLLILLGVLLPPSELTLKTLI